MWTAGTIPKNIKRAHSMSRTPRSNNSEVRAQKTLALTASRPLRRPALIVTRIQYPDESVALKHEAVPHAAIPDSTNHFSLVNTLGESEVDLACSIEGFQLFGGELQIQTGEIVLELRYLPRSNDRDYWHCLMPQPGE